MKSSLLQNSSPVSDDVADETRVRNAGHFSFDALWIGVVQGSILSFLSVYMVLLGASGMQIAMLTIGPAVTNLILSLPFGRWMRGRSLTRLTLRSSIGQRIWLWILPFLPLLLKAQNQVVFLIVLMLVISIPGTLLAISFNATFAALVPKMTRAQVTGRRNGLLAITSTLTTLGCGVLLDRIIFPLNYQIVFGVGAFGAGMASYHLGRLREQEDQLPSEPVSATILDLTRSGLMRLGVELRQTIGLRFLARGAEAPLLRLDLMRGPFGRFMIAYVVFYAFQFIAVPIIPILLVRELALPESVISQGNALFFTVMLIVSLRLQQLSDRFGDRLLLIMGTMLFGLYPLLNGLAQNAGLYLVASLIHGGVWAITGGSITNRLMARVPDDDRPAHMALHNMVLNLGILVGALLGPLLADWIGIRETLILCAALRFGASLLMSAWG